MNLSVQNSADITVIILLAIGNLYWAFRRQRNETVAAESNAMTLLRGTVQTYKDEVDKLTTQSHEQDKKIAAMQATLDEKEKQVNMFEHIFQNRNPEMENFIKETSSAIKEQSSALKLVVELLTKLVQQSNS